MFNHALYSVYKKNFTIQIQINYNVLYRVSKKKTNAFHIQISQKLIAGICLFPRVQQHEVVNDCNNVCIKIKFYPLTALNASN